MPSRPITISAAEARAILAKPKKRANKFNACPTIVDGIRFASRKEARRYGELVMLERAGEILCLTVHPCFVLVVNACQIGKFHPDFDYYDARTS